MIDGANPQPLPALAELPDRVRLPIAIDSAALSADLARLERRDWTAHYVPAHYDGEWSVLPLRAPLGAVHPIQQIASNPSTRDWVDTDMLRAAPAIAALLASMPCPLASVRLMRLAAGSVIHEHRDDDLCAAWGMARLHVPLATNDRVEFRLNGERCVMALGECWYLRLSDRHSVANRGASARVHLVIDALVDDWLEAALLDAAASER